jgi:hypothetical protein
VQCYTALAIHSIFVIPVETGIQCVYISLDARLRGNDNNVRENDNNVRENDNNVRENDDVV